MAIFDSTNASLSGQQDIKDDRAPRVGRVVEVFDHSAELNTANNEVDVKVLGERKHHRSIPYIPAAGNEVNLPTVGDKVIVEYWAGQKSMPVARQAVHTDIDKPPVATAGTWRRVIDSDSSPAGDGDLYVEAFSNYSKNPAEDNPSDDDVDTEQALVRLAKKAADDGDVEMAVEMFDDPQNDSAEVTVKLEKVDGSDSSATWGLKFDLKTGEFKILDADGYGITSDGSGNFEWYHENVNFNEGSTTSL